MIKEELEYFDFSQEPGIKQSTRQSKFVGNTFVSIITYYTSLFVLEYKAMEPM